MKLSLVVSRRAANDVAEVMDFIARDSIDAALRFHEAVCLAYQGIAETPGIGPQVERVPLRLRGLREWPVHGFVNYAIYYIPTADSVDVVRVLHGARNVHRILRDY